jgi:hypothetical protein
MDDSATATAASVLESVFFGNSEWAVRLAHRTLALPSEQRISPQPRLVLQTA